MSNTVLSSNMLGSIPTEQSKKILTKMLEGSICLKKARVEHMETPKKTIPLVMDVPGTTWVGEGEKIKVVKPGIVPVTLEAHKLGFILTASREVLNDSVIDVFEDLHDVIAESFNSLIDRTILTGDTKSPFTKSIYDAALLNGVATTANLDVDISNVMSKVENEGFGATNIIATPSIKGELRSLKSTTKEPLIADTNRIYGVDIDYTSNINSSKTKLIGGDFKYLCMGILEDIKYDILREAILEDGAETINLAQQDLVGIRVTMRVASLILKDEAFSLIKPTV